MKNLVLWMAETNPQLLFTEDQLLDRLTQSLYFLKVKVEANFHRLKYLARSTCGGTRVATRCGLAQQDGGSQSGREPPQATYAEYSTAMCYRGIG